jgi:hypothetical protein
MNREEMDRQLDQWLDRASSEYGTGEARPGFEARVIANVNDRLAGRRLRFRWVLLATAATAVLVLSCYVLLTRFEDHPAGKIVMQKGQHSSLPPIAKQERPPSIVQAESLAKGHVKKHVPIAAIETAKNPFLSAGLSDQERYLLSFVKTVSAQDFPGEFEAESRPLQMPDFELPIIPIPKAQVSFIAIDMVQLPIAHQSEDPL